MTIRETREKHLGYLKKYYQGHKQQAKERSKKWRREQLLINPERIREMDKRAMQKWRLKPSYRFQAIKRNSKKKQFIMSLSKDEFIQWFENSPKNCFYCGVSEVISKAKTGKVLEIDRMDNKVGYELSNMTLACFICNGAKSNLLTADEAKFIGENVIKNKWLH